MRSRLLLVLLLLMPALPAFSQGKRPGKALKEAINKYFSTYSIERYIPYHQMRADSTRVKGKERLLHIYANEPFCSQPFTPQSVSAIYKEIRGTLPSPYNTYRITISDSKGRSIEDLIPNPLRESGKDPSRLWGDITFTRNPWVKNLSKAYTIPRGLAGRHLMINASHGLYYRDSIWKWQRPYLFCTTEDLLTQSFVNPYLIPMLENAGAVVATARERDVQSAEAVVDNDAQGRQGSYSEVPQMDITWQTVPDSGGFAPPCGFMTDSTQLFGTGTARQAATTTRSSRLATATWTPRIPQAGRYAVYVSYITRPNSVSDASYTVFHRGGSTRFRVNQQIGGGTWVYLGTFDFGEGENHNGRVVLTNHSDYRGVVTADGVRFGGGTGQIERGQSGTSGLPRYLEGARYHAQWSGLPDTLYRSDTGMNDYRNDIRSRSYMTNHLGGGSPYMPGRPGKGVPIELALALHSDAGIRPDRSVYGTLAICTTTDGFGNENYISGISRMASADFASALLSGVTSDISRTFRTDWPQRERWDRNYGETRTPDVPAVILEMLSHQNFTDMKYAHDPTFKFTLSRAVYKAILRFVNYEHGINSYDVQPLPPNRFATRLTPDGNVTLSWQPAPDSLCEARPTGYVVYTKMEGEDFDNGVLIRGGKTAYTAPVLPGIQYSFRVTAVNGGGESFPSETLSVRRGSPASKRILIVNGFDRLSGPAWKETADSMGFDLDEDLGVPYLYTTAYSGRQINYDASAAGKEGINGLGYSSYELTGKRIAGNTFDYPVLHGKAIAAAGDYTFTSCSRSALTDGILRPEDYDAVDYICGLQRDAPHNLRPYKTFDRTTRKILTDYLHAGGRLFVSGSFIGSDMTSEEERRFIRKTLKYVHTGNARSDSTGYVRGLSLQIPICRTISSDSYVIQSPDALYPASDEAFTAFAYNDGQSAGIAYPGTDYRVIATGFPFESITDERIRQQAIQAILAFLLEP